MAATAAPALWRRSLQWLASSQAVRGRGDGAGGLGACDYDSPAQPCVGFGWMLTPGVVQTPQAGWPAPQT